VVVGSHAPGVLIHVDRIPVAGETVLARGYAESLDGGKGSNQAVAASRLGARVSFVGRLGADVRGEAAAEMLARDGVDIGYVLRSAEDPTGTGVNLLDSTGTPAMVTVPGANAGLTAEDVERALVGLSSAEVLLVQLEIPESVALAALRRGRRQGMLTILNAAPASLDIDTLSGDFIDVLVVNQVEAQTLLDARTDDGEELAAMLHARTGAERVVVTLGGDGLAACEGGLGWRMPSSPVDVVDTSGAGDAFCAALAVKLADRETLREACSWASRAAAISVTRPGTIEAFPNVCDLDALSPDGPAASVPVGEGM
jgi:ribokinase